MTAGQLITNAFRKLGIRTSESTLTTAEKEDAIEDLNNMMRSLEARSIPLGWTPVSGIDDEITTPDWSYHFLYLTLAIHMAPDYGKEPSRIVYAAADRAYKDVLDHIVEVPMVALPPDMPVGSGSQGIGQSRSDRRFVGDQASEDILTGDGSGLLDETATPLTRNTSGET